MCRRLWGVIVYFWLVKLMIVVLPSKVVLDILSIIGLLDGSVYLNSSYRPKTLCLLWVLLKFWTEVCSLIVLPSKNAMFVLSIVEILDGSMYFKNITVRIFYISHVKIYLPIKASISSILRGIPADRFSQPFSVIRQLSSRRNPIPHSSW